MGNLTRHTFDAESDVLDHAAEFVALVSREAPRRYDAWSAIPDVKQLLAEENAFNAGKLHAWAEYTVFREEFRHRFPDAEDASCINAFCRLFLKNDISLSNLVTFMEAWLVNHQRTLPVPGP
jgi:hypothetical protein